MFIEKVNFLFVLQINYLNGRQLNQIGPGNERTMFVERHMNSVANIYLVTQIRFPSCSHKIEQNLFAKLIHRKNDNFLSFLAKGADQEQRRGRRGAGEGGSDDDVVRVVEVEKVPGADLGLRLALLFANRQQIYDDLIFL